MPGRSTLELARLLSAERYRSGQHIAAALGCTRAAVWKRVQSLRALGIDVDASRGKGYRLSMPLELLDRDAIRSACGPEAGELLKRIEILDWCDSTNGILLRRPDGSRHGQAVLAEAQSAGRGRRGRSWHSPFGRNVYLSLGWRFQEGLGSLTCLPLVVALAAASAVQRVGLRGHGLKWPNDLILDGCKFGGCLVEIQGDLNGPCLAVMGVGINVNLRGEAGAGAIDQAWTDLGSHLAGVSRNALAGYLVAELLLGVRRFEQRGFEPFRRRWEKLDVLAGRTVNIACGAERIGGVAEGIGARGGLLLRNGSGVREYLAGEVTSC